VPDAPPRPAAIAVSPLAVSAIVVSYNTRQMTLDCLRALIDDLRDIPSEIIVVDNASTDSSPDAIRDNFPGVKLIGNSDNRGFGAANNQGMLASNGDNILLINSDAFPKPGAVAAMLATLSAHADAGLVGPRLLNADGSLQRSCFRFPSPGRAWLENLWISALVPADSPLADYRRWGHNALRPVDFVIGACLMVRRTVVEQVGGFDEAFFMYSEESDWQKRIHEAGWKVLFTPTAIVTHLGGASGAAEKSRVNRHFFQSLDFYELKHHGRLGLLLLRAAMIIGCSLRAAGYLACCLLPKRRQSAWAKVKSRIWLVWRQATHWGVLLRPPSVQTVLIPATSSRQIR
jgi:GT2 family glycosyltransferase